MLPVLQVLMIVVFSCCEAVPEVCSGLGRGVACRDNYKTIATRAGKDSPDDVLCP